MSASVDLSSIDFNEVDMTVPFNAIKDISYQNFHLDDYKPKFET